MKIALGSDHAGVRYKQIIGRYLKSLGHDVHDLGPYTETPAVDYPQYIRPVAERVAAGEFERGIILGGSGNGEAIVANRVKGIRCGLCWNVESAKLTREHNNANIISIGQRMVSEETAIAIVQAFLDTPFGGGRHERRIKAIDA